jgi:SiaC family regulatory phosphoprotein
MLGELHILPTDNTPEFLFSPDGMIKIRGRGLFQNKTETIEQIMNWIDEYLSNPAEITYVIIAFEYLNSFSTTILVSILRKLSQVILQSEKLVVQWYYEEDDEDIVERGEYISSAFNIPITFILTTHITDH